MKNPHFLNSAELKVLKDREFMPIKHAVCKKLEQELTRLGETLREEVSLHRDGLPDVLIRSTPKLSRGENYHTYAYRVMDYPRVFERSDMLAFRSMVLWGDSISYHLLMAGTYRTQFLNRLIAAVPTLPEGYVLSAQESPWIWEQQAEGLVPTQHLTEEACADILHARAFVKVSYFLPLEEIDQLQSTGLTVWERWQRMLTATK